MVDTLKEAEKIIREAMKPPEQGRNNFSPAIQGIRQTARQRPSIGRIPARREIPAAR